MYFIFILIPIIFIKERILFQENIFTPAIILKCYWTLLLTAGAVIKTKHFWKFWTETILPSDTMRENERREPQIWAIKIVVYVKVGLSSTRIYQVQAHNLKPNKQKQLPDGGL